jgi:hypothetical protein
MFDGLSTADNGGVQYLLVLDLAPIVEPADGGDELCSAAPPEVSELPAGGIVAALDASGNTVPAVGGVDDDEVSAKPRAAWLKRP